MPHPTIPSRSYAPTRQEFTPARVRGWADLAINGTFWLGAGLGAAGSIVLLDPALLPPDDGWRLCFFIGAVLGLLVLLMRMWIPESPCWLLTHGRPDEAHAIVTAIEQQFRRRGVMLDCEDLPALRLKVCSHTPLREICHALLGRHRRRSLVGLALMAAQAFFYNAIFFTYALVLTECYGVPSNTVGWYLLPLATGNFVGPLLLGRFFDVLGRRIMIAATYAISGVLLGRHERAAVFGGHLLGAAAMLAAADDDKIRTVCSMRRQTQAR